MLTQLELLYKHHFTLQYDEQKTDTYWFQTYDDIIFGINKKAITIEEYTFLNKLFMPYELVHRLRLSIEQQKWYDLLTSTSTPSITTIGAVRLYSLYTREQVKETQQFAHALTGFFEHAIFIPIADKHFVVIEQQATTEYDLDYLQQIQHTLISDFSLQIAMFVGQYHQSPTPAIRQEYTLFQQYLTISQHYKIVPFYEAYIYLHSISSTWSLDVCSQNLVTSLKDPELAHTLRIFFDSNLNSSVASKKLYIHRNSLQYRLDKLLEQTGIDVRQFHQACFVQQLLMKM